MKARSGFGEGLMGFGSGCSIGKHGDMPDSAFDPQQLAMGIRIEMEHTEDREIAKRITKDHLVEDSRYYTKLMKMEREAKR